MNFRSPGEDVQTNMRRDHNEDDSASSRIRQRVIAARRARAAVGFAAIIFLSVIAGCLYRLLFRNNPYGIQAVVLMGVVGIVLLNLGRRATSKRMTELAILRFYRSFRFYGTVVSISAALVFLYALTLEKTDEVRARVKPAPVSAPKPRLESAPEFPKLEVTGVILNGQRSSAIINLKSVQIGGMIEGVQLIKVEEDGVVVELNGHTKKISRVTLPAISDSKSRLGK